MKIKLPQLIYNVFPIIFIGLFCSTTLAGNFNNLIMIDKRGGLVRFFDASTFVEISQLSIDGTPHELALSPDRRTAYVPDYGNGVYRNNPKPGSKIAVIDLETRTLRGNIDISPYLAPHGLQVDAEGTLYVSCDISRKLLIIDPDSLTVSDVIDTEGTGHWLVVLPDGSKAYVANKNDRLFVSVIDLKAKQMIGKIPMPNGTQGISISPDGRNVLAMDLTEPKIVVIDTQSDTVKQEIIIEGNKSGGWQAEYSPNAEKIISINAREKTANIISARDPESKQISVDVGSQPFGIEFTADSEQVLVSNHGDGTVSLIDTQRGKVIKTIQAGTGIETLAYF
ncbi:hypothetical protein NBRC116493_32360 [Aurantivibrio infirmus]